MSEETWKLLGDYSIVALFLWIFIWILFKRRNALKVVGSQKKGWAFRFFLMISGLIYLGTVLYLTLFSRTVHPEHSYELSLLWEYRLAFRFTEDGVAIKSREWVLQILNNIILFVPAGILYGEICEQFKVRSWLIVALLLGTVLSYAIEFTQLVAKLGLFETSDIFNNAIGMAAGYVIYLFAKHVTKVREKEERVRK